MTKATLKQLKERGLAHQDEGEVYAKRLPRPCPELTRCVHLTPDGKRCCRNAAQEWQLGSYVMQTCKVHGWKAHADGQVKVYPYADEYKPADRHDCDEGCKGLW